MPLRRRPLRPPRPPRPVGPRRAALLHAGLRTAGRLSPEVRLALRHGFASGVAVDRVYANRPGRGPTGLGRWLDRRYLNAPGNAALRQRRRHVAEALAQAARRLWANQDPPLLFAPAAGAARTAIDFLQTATAAIPAARAVVGDISPAARAAARAAAGAAGVEPRIVVRAVDAFARPSLETALAGAAPNLIVVSGLYELEPDDARVAASLTALATLAAPRAFLVLTGMNAHPQAALIQRLTGVAPPPGRAVDALADRMSPAGFLPVRRWSGDRGLFDVVLLERPAAGAGPQGPGAGSARLSR